MPVRQIGPARSREHEALVRDLLSEWDNPSPEKTEPLILEESTGGHLAHLYVIWSRWASIDRVERSEIIMEAAERRLPRDEVLNITIAMGLTFDEADRMGLKY